MIKVILDRGRKGDPGSKGARGEVVPAGAKGDRGEVGVSGDKGDVGTKGGKGDVGTKGDEGVLGPVEVPGVKGNVGSRGPAGTKGYRSEQSTRGSSDPIGPKGVQDIQGANGDRGERGDRGVKGDKGIQCDNSNVLDVLAEHLPIQLATRYGEKMCFIMYHMSEDGSNIVELAAGVGSLRCVSAYHEPAWHFDAKFVNGEAHEMSNVQKATGHGHFLEMKNSAYYCLYDLASNKVNGIYIDYKIRRYDGNGTEHNYLFSCGMDYSNRGIWFLVDGKTRVHGTVGDRKPNYMDIPNFPTSNYNPCQKDRWNVVGVVYDTTSSKSSLWVNHGKVCDFACRLPIKTTTLNLFNRVAHFDDASGFIYYKTIPSGLIAARM